MNSIVTCHTCCNQITFKELGLVVAERQLLCSNFCSIRIGALRRPFLMSTLVGWRVGQFFTSLHAQILFKMNPSFKDTILGNLLLLESNTRGWKLGKWILQLKMGVKLWWKHWLTLPCALPLGWWKHRLKICPGDTCHLGVLATCSGFTLQLAMLQVNQRKCSFFF